MENQHTEDTPKPRIRIASRLGLATIVASLFVIILWAAGYFFWFGFGMGAGKGTVYVDSVSGFWIYDWYWGEERDSFRKPVLFCIPYDDRYQKIETNIGFFKSVGPNWRTLFSLKGFTSSSKPMSPVITHKFRFFIPSSVGFYLAVALIGICIPFTFRRETLDTDH